MLVELAYGAGRLAFDSPAERTTVIAPRHLPAALDARAAVVEALRSPVAGPSLRDIVRPGQTVAISVCDGTRPQPRRIVVPALLEELDGITRLEDVVVLVATGTHRGNTDSELLEMLGRDVLEAVEVVNHDAEDAGGLAWMGTLGDGVPVWLNRRWVEADVRITTGYVEPHFFAGFSGGPKLAAPGLAGLETTLVLHDARRIAHPSARWGVTEGNPVHDDIRAVAAGTGVDFALDVVLDGEQRIVQAFAGELFSAHRAACETSRRSAMCPVVAPFDVVVTSNAGFPLDQNLYQAVKGMSAAAQVVREGGTIICAAECRDRFPDHGSYHAELLREPTPERLAQSIESRTATQRDQWQVQVQANIQRRARVVMHTSFLSSSDLREAHLEATDDIGATLLETLDAAGPSGRVCVLPEGPITIPYVA